MTAGPVTASESAVLVPFPEAERVASPYRARLDGAVALGVPAHVTVLYPFMRCWRDIDGASMPLPGKRV